MDKVRRGALAKEILANPLWEETFNDLNAYYYEQFRLASDLETQRRIAMANDLLDDFRDTLQEAVVNGVRLGGDT